MKSTIAKSIILGGLLALAGGATASGEVSTGPGEMSATSFPDVVEAWGSGPTRWAARDNARSSGHSACLNAGASSSSFEEVETLQTGGGFITYGLSYCY